MFRVSTVEIYHSTVVRTNVLFSMIFFLRFGQPRSIYKIENDFACRILATFFGTHMFDLFDAGQAEWLWHGSRRRRITEEKKTNKLNVRESDGDSQTRNVFDEKCPTNNFFCTITTT